MACNKKARDATVDRIVNIGARTILLRFIDNNSQYRSFWSDFWQVSKAVIKEDKQAVPDLFKAVRCWLGL